MVLILTFILLSWNINQLQVVYGVKYIITIVIGSDSGFGHTALLSEDQSRARRNATIIALSDVDCAVIGRAHFLAVKENFSKE